MLEYMYRVAAEDAALFVASCAKIYMRKLCGLVASWFDSSTMFCAAFAFRPSHDIPQPTTQPFSKPNVQFLWVENIKKLFRSLYLLFSPSPRLISVSILICCYVRGLQIRKLANMSRKNFFDSRARLFVSPSPRWLWSTQTQNTNQLHRGHLYIHSVYHADNWLGTLTIGADDVETSKCIYHAMINESRREFRRHVYKKPLGYKARRHGFNWVAQTCVCCKSGATNIMWNACSKSVEGC